MDVKFFILWPEFLYISRITILIRAQKAGPSPFTCQQPAKGIDLEQGLGRILINYKAHASDNC